MKHDHPSAPAVTWRLQDLRLFPREDESVLAERAAQALGLAREELRGLRIARKALDARRRNPERRLEFVCHVDVVLEGRTRTRAMGRLERTGKLVPSPRRGTLAIERVHRSLASDRPASPPVEVVPMAVVEKNTYLHALRACGGHVALAARALGVSKTQFYLKLKNWERDEKG